MKKNMGLTDKSIRLVLAMVLLGLYLTDVVSGTLGLVLLVVAALFVLTSLVSICPAYMPFGISTCKTKSK